jgi:hypothetical protein
MSLHDSSIESEAGTGRDDDNDGPRLPAKRLYSVPLDQQPDRPLCATGGSLETGISRKISIGGNEPTVLAAVCAENAKNSSGKVSAAMHCGEVAVGHDVTLIASSSSSSTLDCGPMSRREYVCVQQSSNSGALGSCPETKLSNAVRERLVSDADTFEEDDKPLCIDLNHSSDDTEDEVDDDAANDNNNVNDDGRLLAKDCGSGNMADKKSVDFDSLTG